MHKTILPIQAVARKLQIPEKYFEQIGPYGAKVRLEILADSAYTRLGKLILVTATTPTASGEGKTVTAIGLTQGLALLGKKVVITSREPSLISMEIFTPYPLRTICFRRLLMRIFSTATI
jgi:formate--tetrahydrofolate ligase